MGKDKMIAVRLSGLELAKIREFCEKNDFTVSEAIRLGVLSIVAWSDAGRPSPLYGVIEGRINERRYLREIFENNAYYHDDDDGEV